MDNKSILEIFPGARTGGPHYTQILFNLNFIFASKQKIPRKHKKYLFHTKNNFIFLLHSLMEA